MSNERIGQEFEPAISYWLHKDIEFTPKTLVLCKGTEIGNVLTIIILYGICYKLLYLTY